jgi:hypothetical protein
MSWCRNAIEEELEVLYEAYYEELEQYANHHHLLDIADPRLALLPPGAVNYAHSWERGMQQTLTKHHHHHHHHADRDGEDDEDDDEDYGDEEDDDEDVSYTTSDTTDVRNSYHFGNSFTAKSGILTVADDLLKNDGKTFLEMMERLAERRLQREDEASNAERPSTTLHDTDDVGDDEDDCDVESEEGVHAQEHACTLISC